MSNFMVGDLVHINKDIGKQDCKTAFTEHADRDAIIDFTDQNGEQYALYIKGQGLVAWFDDSDLEFIEHHKEDLKKEWEKEIEEREKQTSDLDWIFSQNTLEDLTGDSFQALYSCLGGHSLWGSNGEGWNYYWNTRITAKLVEPFLKEHDKEGFLKFAKDFKKLWGDAKEFEKALRKEINNEQ